MFALLALLKTDSGEGHGDAASEAHGGRGCRRGSVLAVSGVVWKHAQEQYRSLSQILLSRNPSLSQRLP